MAMTEEARSRLRGQQSAARTVRGVRHDPKIARAKFLLLVSGMLAGTNLVLSDTAYAQCAGTTCSVTNEGELRTAITYANNNAGITINLQNSITLTTGDLPALQGIDTIINGSGTTLSGDDKYRGLFVYSGSVRIENLTISQAVAQGGKGGNGGTNYAGGGGAGLGGALFVNAGAQVSVSNVTLDSNAARGGNGGTPGSGSAYGGGAGMGGDGGSPASGNGGGGGLGRGADGASTPTSAGGGGGRALLPERRPAATVPLEAHRLPVSSINGAKAAPTAAAAVLARMPEAGAASAALPGLRSSVLAAMAGLAAAAALPLAAGEQEALVAVAAPVAS